MNLYIIPVSFNDFSPALRGLVRTYKDVNFLVYHIFKQDKNKLCICYISDNQICRNVVWDKKYKNKKPYKQIRINTQNLGELKKVVSRKTVPLPWVGFVYSDTQENIRETNFIGYIIEGDLETTLYINNHIKSMTEIIRNQIRSAYELIQNTGNIWNSGL